MRAVSSRGPSWPPRTRRSPPWGVPASRPSVRTTIRLPEEERMQLGFIGAGRIGRRMIGRLVAAGHQVRVLDRSEAARVAVEAAGAIPVDELTMVVQDAQAVLL